MVGFVLVVIAVFVIAATTVAAASGRIGGRRNGVYSELAQRFNGVAVSGGWFRSPQVRFNYGRTQVTLSARGSHGGATCVDLVWPDPRLNCEIYSRTMAQPATLVQAPMLSIGDAEFVDRFCVRCQDEDAAQHWLSSGVRWQILKLGNLFGDADLHVIVQRGWLMIEKRTRLRRIEELHQFVQLSLEMFDQAMLTRSDGIDFLEDGSAQIVDDAKCQICGEEITVQMVYCRSCKTPHHLDCWQYYGSCSTYGCRETQCLFPGVAQAIEVPDAATESLEAEPASAESVDAESVDAESIDAEPSDAESVAADFATADSARAQSPGAEQDAGEPTDEFIETEEVAADGQDELENDVDDSRRRESESEKSVMEIESSAAGEIPEPSGGDGIRSSARLEASAGREDAGVDGEGAAATELSEADELRETLGEPTEESPQASSRQAHLEGEAG